MAEFRRKIGAVLFFLASLGPVAATMADDDPPADKIFWARVVKVRDGDTIEVVRENLDLIAVRLYGIDAPEDGQPFGGQATRKLTKLINKKIVLVEVIRARDRYGRTVGVVKLEGRDVALDMAEAGSAWVDPRFCKRKKICNGYWARARQAQKNKQGLWQDPKPVKPWEWRKSTYSFNK